MTKLFLFLIAIALSHQVLAKELTTAEVAKQTYLVGMPEDDSCNSSDRQKGIGICFDNSEDVRTKHSKVIVVASDGETSEGEIVDLKQVTCPNWFREKNIEGLKLKKKLVWPEDDRDRGIGIVGLEIKNSPVKIKIINIDDIGNSDKVFADQWKKVLPKSEHAAGAIYEFSIENKSYRISSVFISEVSKLDSRAILWVNRENRWKVVKRLGNKFQKPFVILGPFANGEYLFAITETQQNQGRFLLESFNPKDNTFKVLKQMSPGWINLDDSRRARF